MKTGSRRNTIAAALLLVSISCAAFAQRGRVDERVDRAARAVEKAQQRADQAQERAAKIPEQTERAQKVQERASRVADQVDRGQRAERAAARADEVQARNVERAERREAERANENRGRAGEAPSRSQAEERSLADAQKKRQETLVLSHPRELEMTRGGPAVRGQVVAIDPSPAALAAAKRAGFTVLAEETIEGLDIRSVTLRTPSGLAVDQALVALARAAPRGDFAPNHLHLQNSAAPMRAAPAAAQLAQGRVPGRAALGIIDGGVARHPSLTGPVEQRGFVQGAPAAHSHATAIASLAAGNGRLRGPLAGAPLLVADIYGRDPAGGNAVALVRALGWMVARQVPVVAVALAGPSNPLVAKAVARATQRGLFLVAPVGNGGPAAPPSYPASYPAVVAVTGVDARNRLLIESGRCPKVDYAAPAAGFLAANAAGGFQPVRGTSFAVPFVAGRLASIAKAGAKPLALLDQEAIDLGPRGSDRLYGRGLVCGNCRPLR